MDKPITLRLREFKDSALDLVNESGLPLILIEPILKDILAAVQNKNEQEYQQAKAVYEASLIAKSEEEVEG